MRVLSRCSTYVGIWHQNSWCELQQSSVTAATIDCRRSSTDYGLDGPEIKSRWARDFSHMSRPALGPTQPPVQWVPGLSWG
jgi:hypothetical protein